MYVVASQAPGDIAFTSLYAMYLADTPEGVRSVGAVAIAYEWLVGWEHKEKRGRHE